MSPAIRIQNNGSQVFYAEIFLWKKVKLQLVRSQEVSKIQWEWV